MRTDSSGEIRASSPRRYARALRNAWMAGRLNDFMALADTTQIDARQAALRDSVIAEGTRWALRQEGSGARLVFFAHDGHIMNARNDFRHADVPGFRNLRGWYMAGHHLRAWFGADLVVVVSTASGAVVRRYWVNGASGNPSDPTSLDAALALVGQPAFVLDVRRADAVPSVAAILRRPWLFRLQTFFEDVVPGNAFDAVVYFNQITPSKDDVRDVDSELMLYTDSSRSSPASSR
jgi:erythromycin esterase